MYTEDPGWAKTSQM